MLVQRLGSQTQKNESFIDDLCNNIKNNPNSCQEVWFATDYGFPSIETHKKTAETIKKFSEKFEKIGVKVSLQISNTIGHGAYISSYDCSGLVYEGSKAERLVGHDGTIADYCFCPAGKNVLDYNIAYIKEYAKIKPLKIWLDDDLRLTNHNPVKYACFCDNCIDRFNKENGTSFTREELVKEMNFGDIKWRIKYLDYLRKIMYDFTYEISKAVHEVSPDTIVCLQYGPRRAHSGYDHNHILDAMRDATGHIPYTRPGGGCYDDYDVNDFFRKSHELDRESYTLPDYIVEKYPEIENLPDVMFGKTIAGTCFETSLYFARGNTGMTYAIMMRDNEPREWHGKMLQAFSEHYDYWKKMSEINRTTTQAGITLGLAKKYYLAKTDKEFAWNSEPVETGGLELEKCAIPLAYSKDTTSTFFLHYNCASVMSDDELEQFFDKPVITDGATLEMLINKGYKFDVKVEKINCVKLTSKYNDHICNKDFLSYNSIKPFLTTESYKLYELDESAEILQHYESGINVADENNGAVSAAIITAPCGGRWAVFGNHIWNPIISSSGRNHILNVAEYLNPGRCTARLITPAKGVFLPRENDKHELACVSFVNCTVAKSESLKVKVRRPVGLKAYFMSQYNGKCNIELIKDEKEDCYYLDFPPIDAYSVGTVFFE